MQNLDKSTLTLSQIESLVSGDIKPEEAWAYSFFLLAIQNDNIKLPSVYNEQDCREVGGSKTFPTLPDAKIGLLFLPSGTYEAAVVGGADKWRRLYDGTTFDPSTALP